MEFQNYANVCVKTLFYFPCRQYVFHIYVYLYSEIIIILPAWNRHIFTECLNFVDILYCVDAKVYIILMWFVSSGLIVAFNAQHERTYNTIYDVLYIEVDESCFLELMFIILIIVCIFLVYLHKNSLVIIHRFSNCSRYKML